MIQISDKKQKLFEAVYPPCMILSIAGIILAIGYALCPQSMQGGPISGIFGMLGMVLVRIAGAVSDNAGFLFAASTAMAYAKEQRTQAALFGVSGFLILSALSSSYLVASISPGLSTLSESLVYLPAPLSGFLTGKLAAAILNRQDDSTADQTKSILLLISGSAACSIVLIGLWMAAYTAVTALGSLLADGSTVSIALFTILNRVLMPFDLHHGLNRIILFQEGTGDLVTYWANQTVGDPGRYMSGFFAPMMFGVPSIAFYLSKKRDLKKEHRQYLFCAAVCSFLIGFSEPLEFLLFFTMPEFYLLYCLLYGIFGALTAISGFRAGFALSGGLCDLIFSAACPAASHTWQIVPLGFLAALLFYGMCRLLDRFRSLKTK